MVAERGTLPNAIPPPSKILVHMLLFCLMPTILY